MTTRMIITRRLTATHMPGQRVETTHTMDALRRYARSWVLGFSVTAMICVVHERNQKSGMRHFSVLRRLAAMSSFKSRYQDCEEIIEAHLSIAPTFVSTAAWPSAAGDATETRTTRNHDPIRVNGYVRVEPVGRESIAWVVELPWMFASTAASRGP
jgi:hypothetical protein